MNPGNYKATIMGAQATQASTGTPCMEVEVDVDDGDGAARMKIYVYFSTKKKASARKSVENNLRMLAINGWDGSMTKPMFEDAEVMVKLFYEDYEGSPKEKCEFLNNGFQANPMDNDHMKALEKKAKAMIGSKTDDDGAIDPDESPF